MDALQHFIVDLENFLEQNGYEIVSSMDIDLVKKDSGKLVGYWPSTVNHESFKELP